MRDEQESHWVRMCLMGETKNFSYIVARYERMVRTMIHRLVADEVQAEELAHQTFVTAYEQLHKFDGRSKLSTWLGTIALNKARDYLRQESRRRTYISDYDYEDLPQDQPDLESRVQASQLSDMLQGAIYKLSSRDRDVLVLRFICEQDFRSIAEQLGCSTAAAKMRNGRALTALRRVLERMGATA